MATADFLIRDSIQKAVRSSEDHAIYLNTLSYLEFLGSRAIMASVGADSFSAEVLNHLLEETRHAMTLKAAAEKLSGRRLTYGAEDLFADASARAYFNRLAVLAKRQLRAIEGDVAECALYMASRVLEERAVEWYGLYDALLSKSEKGFPAQAILADEVGHIRCVEVLARTLDPRYDENLSEIRKGEGILFSRLMENITHRMERGQHGFAGRSHVMEV